MSEETKQPTERETLMDKANLMGLEFPNNISTAKLRDLVNKEIDPKAVVTKEAKEPALEGKVIAKELTDEEKLQIMIQQSRKELMTLRRVIVSCNDPQMKEWETTPPFSISNSLITLPRVVVPLNVEWHIPQAVYNVLKEQKCGIPVKGKDVKGRPITRRKEISKYNIQDLNPLDAEELKILKQAQANRDGVAKD